MPPGIDPPYIVQYSATSVPIVQIAVSSDTLTEQQIFDYAANFIIQRLGVVQGARVPQPWGGKCAAGHGRSRPRRSSTPAAFRPRTSRLRSTARTSSCPSGTAKIGDTRVLRQAQQQPAVDRRLQQHAGQDGQRRADLRQGRGQRPHGLRGANQRRPPRRPPRRADDHPQGRGRVEPGRGPARPRGPARHPGPGAARAEDGAALRPVGLRPRRGRGGPEGGGDCGRADGADDPGLPRLLAEHPDRRHLHPPVDSHFGHRPLGHGPVAQHHDARRAGAGGRRAGGRRHRGIGERPPQLRRRQADPPGDPRQCRADRHAGVRCRPWRFASSLCRSCSSAGRRRRSSTRWRWQWCSPF